MDYNDKDLLTNAIENNDSLKIKEYIEKQKTSINEIEFKKNFFTFDEIIEDFKIVENNKSLKNHYKHRENNNSFLILQNKSTKEYRLFCYNPELEINDYKFYVYTYDIGITTLRDFHNLIEYYYPEEKDNSLTLTNKAADEILTEILKTGIDLGATDLYINVVDKIGFLIYKVDGFNLSKGELQESQTKRVFDIVMNHSGQSQKSYGEIKGKLEWQVRGKLHSLRLSIGKKATGEQFMVLRFLSSFNPDLRLDRLGFYQDHISKVAEMTSMDNGIIFVTGSTGEGKSTTMGVILNELATEQKKMVFTIEDPVEVNNPHLIQYQVQEEGEDKYHMGFSTYSKLLKRQNPDIVLLGEVRDKEEIEECIKMSKAGQLVFTTLHSSSTIQTMGRLKDEGITNGDLIDSLRGIISQKLYPKLCKCKIRLLETDPEYISGYDFIQYKRNRIGCQICRDKNKGFDGKVLIYEIRIFEGLDNDRLKTNIYVLPSLDVAERKFEEGLIEGPILNKIKKSTITGENNESK